MRKLIVGLVIALSFGVGDCHARYVCDDLFISYNNDLTDEVTASLYEEENFIVKQLYTDSLWLVVFRGAVHIVDGNLQARDVFEEMRLDPLESQYKYDVIYPDQYEWSYEYYTDKTIVHANLGDNELLVSHSGYFYIVDGSKPYEEELRSLYDEMYYESMGNPRWEDGSAILDYAF